jgi:hypothetical protein
MSKIDLRDLEKISADIADNLLTKASTLEHFDNVPEQCVPVPQTKSAPISPPVDNSIRARARPLESQAAGSRAPTSVATPSTPGTFNIVGLNVPMKTLYLFIVLLVVGVILFFKSK